MRSFRIYTVHHIDNGIRRACSMHGRKRNTEKTLVGQPVHTACLKHHYIILKRPVALTDYLVLTLT
jgi:hypothetical protein